MTKRVLRKQVSEKMKIYFMGVLFIVLTIGIINACNIWQGEAVKKDFYNHIPAIQVYQSNGLLGDNILISEWKEDDKHVNYYKAIDDKSAKNYYINNSGKVLYELD